MLRKVGFCLGILLVAGCGPDGGVRVGVVAPLTGEFSIYGSPVRKGVELAIEELAAAGTSIDLEVVDTEGDSSKAKELMEGCIDNGAMAVIGGVMSVEALEMVQVADRYDRVLLSPSASNPALTGISRNFYRVFPSDALEGTTMGNFAYQKLGLESTVIVAKEETYAKGNQEVFRAEFERNGGQVLETIEYPAGAGDFSGLLERVVGLDPPGVYLAAFADDIGAMITELRGQGYEGKILTTSAFSSPEAIEQVGEQAQGVFLTQAVFEADSEDPNIQAFVAAYREKYGFAPDLYAAHGYDAMMVLAEAIATNTDGAPSDLWKSMRSLRNFTGVTGAVQFDERGDVQKFPRVYVVQDGNLVDYVSEIEEKRKELLERLRALQEAQRSRSGN